jgi:hypothetical protein
MQLPVTHTLVAFKIVEQNTGYPPRWRLNGVDILSSGHLLCYMFSNVHSNRCDELHLKGDCGLSPVLPSTLGSPNQLLQQPLDTPLAFFDGLQARIHLHRPRSR